MQICRNRLPTHIVEEDSRDDHILIAFLRLQKFQGIVERNSSVDEILSGSKEGFGFFKNLLMDRLYQHKDFYKPNYFSSFTTKVPIGAPMFVATGLHFTFSM